jgi:hypothetical protein
MDTTGELPLVTLNRVARRQAQRAGAVQGYEVLETVRMWEVPGVTRFTFGLPRDRRPGDPDDPEAVTLPLKLLSEYLTAELTLTARKREIAAYLARSGATWNTDALEPTPRVPRLRRVARRLGWWDGVSA